MHIYLLNRISPQHCDCPEERLVELHYIVSECCKAILHYILHYLTEAQPKKICSQIRLCTFNGARGVSMGIESVVDEGNGRLSGFGDAMCSCEMAVVWMQNQLRQNQTQDRILNYVNELCDGLAQ